MAAQLLIHHLQVHVVHQPHVAACRHNLWGRGTRTAWFSCQSQAQRVGGGVVTRHPIAQGGEQYYRVLLQPLLCWTITCLPYHTVHIVGGWGMGIIGSVLFMFSAQHK